MNEKIFIKNAIRNSAVEEYIRKEAERAELSHIDIQRTPLNTRIVVYCGKPGILIGKRGSEIEKITNLLKNRFKFDNPILEVQSVEVPDLDANIVARQLASALERGQSYKRMQNIYLERIMKAGAVGAEIILSGKLGGGRGRVEKLLAGYIKKCGHPSVACVDKAVTRTSMKPGEIGIKVKIMKEFPLMLSLEKGLSETDETAEEPKKDETGKTEPKKEATAEGKKTGKKDAGKKKKDNKTAKKKTKTKKAEKKTKKKDVKT